MTKKPPTSEGETRRIYADRERTFESPVRNAILHFLWVNGLYMRCAWDCAPSMISVVAGFGLMNLFPEARDLFNDRIGISGLAAYAALVVLVWALQVYGSARARIAAKQAPVIVSPAVHLEEFQYRSLSHSLRTFRAVLPLVLGSLTFIAIVLGIFLARQELTICERIETEALLKSCLGYADEQDLLEFDDTRRVHGPTDYSLPEITESLKHLNTAAGFIGAAAVLFLVLVVLVEPHVRRWLGREDNRFSTHAARILMLANVIVMGLVLGTTFYLPFELTDWAGRASLIPILVGTWIAIWDCLMRLSRQIQAWIGLPWPFATIAVLALLLASTYVDKFHDMRVYKTSQWLDAQPSAKGSAAVQRQIYLDQAIDQWMASNGCAAQPSSCPMVLVASEGGASRSAFFTATVLGALLDETRNNPDKYVDFARATFVLSGVSGGALGVATFRTALLEATGQAPPCRHVDAGWFAANHGPTNDSRNPTKSWRACLQLLTVGDYLSPTIVGLSFRDYFALLAPSDRAVLLEQGIERHYNHVVHGEKSACGGQDDKRGFCRPFGYVRESGDHWRPLLMLNATSVDSGRPILVSDIYTPVISPDLQDCKDLFVVANNVFELYATNPFKPAEKNVDDMGSCVYPNLEKARDVRLSTATVLSARFPIISPAGSIRYTDESRNFVADHVVDGGYFDNSGLDTLNQILPFLKAKGIQPTILYLTNDPWFYKGTERAGRPHSGSTSSLILPTDLEPPRQGFWSAAFALLTDPLQTIYDLRAGHKEAALERTVNIVGSGALIPLRVRRGVYLTREETSFCIDKPTRLGQSRITLSQPIMSWWLSPVSQRVLDAQLCDQVNITALETLLSKLERKQ
jgi:hypothetical protein